MSAPPKPTAGPSHAAPVRPSSSASAGSGASVAVSNKASLLGDTDPTTVVANVLNIAATIYNLAKPDEAAAQLASINATLQAILGVIGSIETQIIMNPVNTATRDLETQFNLVESYYEDGMNQGWSSPILNKIAAVDARTLFFALSTAVTQSGTAPGTDILETIFKNNGMQGVEDFACFVMCKFAEVLGILQLQQNLGLATSKLVSSKDSKPSATNDSKDSKAVVATNTELKALDQVFITQLHAVLDGFGSFLGTFCPGNAWWFYALQDANGSFSKCSSFAMVPHVETSYAALMCAFDGNIIMVGATDATSSGIKTCPVKTLTDVASVVSNGASNERWVWSINAAPQNNLWQIGCSPFASIQYPQWLLPTYEDPTRETVVLIHQDGASSSTGWRYSPPPSPVWCPLDSSVQLAPLQFLANGQYLTYNLRDCSLRARSAGFPLPNLPYTPVDARRLVVARNKRALAKGAMATTKLQKTSVSATAPSGLSNPIGGVVFNITQPNAPTTINLTVTHAK